VVRISATDPEVRARFPVLPDFLRSSGSKTGSNQPQPRWPRETLYLQKLALILPVYFAGGLTLFLLFAKSFQFGTRSEQLDAKGRRSQCGASYRPVSEEHDLPAKRQVYRSLDRCTSMSVHVPRTHCISFCTHHWHRLSFTTEVNLLSEMSLSAVEAMCTCISLNIHHKDKHLRRMSWISIVTRNTC
jgi:hypothetical protein